MATYQLKYYFSSYESLIKLNPNNLFATDKIILLKMRLNGNERLKTKLSLPAAMQELSANDKNQVCKSLVLIVNQIYKELCVKLFKDATIFWLTKLSTCYKQDEKEICQYFQQILRYLITSNKVQQLVTENFNVNAGGFGSIHFGFNFYNYQLKGIYKNEKVAIKELQFNQNQKNDDFIYLLREIGILAYCDHPNIAKIKAVYFNPNKINNKYYVQIIQPRYFKDLHYALFREKTQNINKKMICYQILKALSYIHDTGLVHLDLKPQNLMFCDGSLTNIVILDFGISDIQRENQNTKIQGISIAYCSPEIRFQDLSKISPKADIFSFGMYLYFLSLLNCRILYELITERRAWAKYQKQNNQSLLYNIIRSPNFLFFSENMTTGINYIDELIQKCTSIDVAQRPSARETLEIIKKFKFEF